MKIRIAAFLVAVCMAATLSACGTTIVKEDSSAEREDMYSVLSAEATTEAESETVEEIEYTTAETTTYEKRKQPNEVYVYGYYTDPERPEDGMLPLTYNGNDLVIYVNMPVAEKFYQEGIFVMIDGVRQNIRVECNGVVSEETQMYIYNSTDAQNTTLKIYVDPNVGKKGNTVYMSVCTYSYPTYVPAEKMFTAIADGYHSDSMTDMYPVEVKMNCDAVNTVAVCSDYSAMTVEAYDSVIEKQMNEYDLSVKLGLASRWVSVEPSKIPDGIFYKNLEENLYSEWGAWCIDRNVGLDGSESEKISVVFYENVQEYTGNLEGDFRVSLYIDHEVVPVFDGCDYADITIEKGKQTVLDLEIDASELSEYSRCYIILAGLDGEAPIYAKYDCRLVKQ